MSHSLRTQQPAAAVAATSAKPAASSRSTSRRAVAPARGWRAWLELTKPRIIMLMLVTCLAAMVLAQDGLPPLSLIATTLTGLALSIAGASTLNHVLDRNLDRRMARTRMRPVASGEIGPRAAAAYGLSLFTLGGALLSMYVNPLAAWCALIGGAFYVLVYTPLKRITIHNTVLGGVAGAMPPLVGWAAVTGSLDSVLAWTLFAIMFAWQPAHFWPLSLLIREDYAEAGFRMLPVDRGEHATVVATWRWTWLAIATTFIPVVAGEVGYVYVVGVVVANAFLVRRMWALVAADRNVADGGVLVGGPESAGRIAARRAFLGSMSWLAMIFVVFIVDALAS